MTKGNPADDDAETGCAFNVPVFCRRNSISPAFYFKMKKLGYGPVEMAVGTRRIITPESEARWRREREAVAQAEREPEIAAG